MEQLVAILNEWRRHNSRCFGVLSSTHQFLFAVANIAEASIDQIEISVQEVVKRLELAPQEPFTKVAIQPSSLLAAWHSTTFNQPNASFVAEKFDEVLQLFIKGELASVTLYRASEFRGKQRGGLTRR